MAMTKKFSSSSTFSLCISFLSLLSAASAFRPTDHYLVNCGSRAAETLDIDHRVFAGDDSRFLTTGRTTRLEGLDSDLASPSPIYRTARAFNRPARYAFPIGDRGAHHLVRLHFHPLVNDNFDDLFEAEFHVVANGFLLLRNFRIPRSGDFPLIKEFVIPVVSDELEITFMPSEKSKFGFVSAIEVISAPSDSIPNMNITWSFEVLKGYSYTVRIIASVAAGMLYFNVYVNGNLAYENLDLLYITNRLLASPFYADFRKNLTQIRFDRTRSSKKISVLCLLFDSSLSLNFPSTTR